IGGGVGAFFLLREPEKPPDQAVARQPIGRDNQGGGDQNEQPPREENLPKGQVVNMELGGPRQTVPGFTPTGINLNGGTPHPCLSLAPDGKSFYSLIPNGVLQQIALDGLREQRHVALWQNCGWLSLSAEGLLVTVQSNDQTQGCWVVDPVSLDV